MKRPKGLLSVIYLVITLFLGFVMIQAGEIATILEAFTPAMYYEVDIPQMPEIHYLSWMMLSVCIFIAAVSRRITMKGNAARAGVCVLSAAVTVLSFIYFGNAFKSDAKMRIYRLECLATNGDWDEIIHLHWKDVRSQNENRIEVYDSASDVVVYDVDRHEITWSPFTRSKDSFETFPTFSPDGNSRWLVFSSRRIDGLYTRPFFWHIDGNGQASKPFLLPRKNPLEYYADQMNSYNIPELMEHKATARMT